MRRSGILSALIAASSPYQSLTIKIYFSQRYLNRVAQLDSVSDFDYHSKKYQKAAGSRPATVKNDMRINFLPNLLTIQSLYYHYNGR